MATETKTENTGKKYEKKYVILVLLTALPQWLQLSRAQRAEFVAAEVAPIIEKYADRVHIRWLDTEAFNARCSDIAMLEANELQNYYFFMEALRDTPFFAYPYFSLEDVIISLEDGFKTFEAQL
jgi:hypothetical protein